MRTLMAHRPNYAPYVGFFDRVAMADILVLQDDLSYVKQEWQNRNRIRSGDSWRWLTLPVHGSHQRAVNETFPVEKSWLPRQLRILRHEYSGTKAYSRIDRLGAVLGDVRTSSLAVINETLIRHVLQELGIDVEIIRESDLGLPRILEPNYRLLQLCQLQNCGRYLAGPGGQNYFLKEVWMNGDVEVDEHAFLPTPYGRNIESWQPNLSVLDYLLSVDNPISEWRCTSVTRKLHTCRERPPA